MPDSIATTEPFRVGDVVTDTLSGKTVTIARLIRAGVNAFPTGCAIRMPDGTEQLRGLYELRSAKE